MMPGWAGRRDEVEPVRSAAKLDVECCPRSAATGRAARRGRSARAGGARGCTGGSLRVGCAIGRRRSPATRARTLHSATRPCGRSGRSRPGGRGRRCVSDATQRRGRAGRLRTSALPGRSVSPARWAAGAVGGARTPWPAIRGRSQGSATTASDRTSGIEGKHPVGRLAARGGADHDEHSRGAHRRDGASATVAEVDGLPRRGAAHGHDLDRRRAWVDGRDGDRRCRRCDPDRRGASSRGTRASRRSSWTTRRPGR